MKKLLLLPLFFLPCFAQEYAVTKTTTLAGAAEVITVQQPATGARQVTFRSFYIDCSVACTISLERNGSAATSTTLAVNNINPGEGAATTTAWSSSNVGTGTVLAKYNINAGGSMTVDLTGIYFNQGNPLGTATNLTIRTSSITGTVDIIVRYWEKAL